MDNTTIMFVTIIFVIVGILQIILFFKIWIMTNDVKRIKENTPQGPSIELAQKFFMLGDSDKAFIIYKSCFIDEIVAELYKYEYGESYEERYKKICDKYNRSLNALGEKYSIDFSKYDTEQKMQLFLQQ